MTGDLDSIVKILQGLEATPQGKEALSGTRRGEYDWGDDAEGSPEEAGHE